MGASKWFFSMSGLILLIGALAIAGKGINFGIDFESGTRITAPLTQAGDRRATCAARSSSQGFGDAKIQTVDNQELGKHVVQVSTDTLAPDGRRRGQQGARATASGSPTTPTSSRSARRSASRSPTPR